ncbi:ATP-binding protein [Streptomyces sp. NBC_00386]|jgi:anti-sigma regulatory factor (Ser/Thr protein kinase)|uniref:ATP-binding protein n=1 Tax=Streptomyces sp. NBC_00386 TaxID=2975734 RepID=UPI002E1EFEBB
MDSSGKDSGPPSTHPIATAVPLNGGNSCIAAARHRAADFLTHAQADQNVVVSARVMDLTQLVVSELVTNARKYAPGPILMELRIEETTVEVTVRDCGRAQPIVFDVDPLRIGQHGLEIVRAVTRKFQVQAEPSGKRVTAHIALGDDSEPGPG